MLLNPNTIINGDCLNVMPTLPANSVDFILPDRPYLVNYKSRDNRTVPNDNNDRWLRPACAEMYRVLKPDSFCVSFYGFTRYQSFNTPSAMPVSESSATSFSRSATPLPLSS